MNQNGDNTDEEGKMFDQSCHYWFDKSEVVMRNYLIPVS